jgi:hypothetical protein
VGTRAVLDAVVRRKVPSSRRESIIIGRESENDESVVVPNFVKILQLVHNLLLGESHIHIHTHANVVFGKKEQANNCEF